MKVTHVNLSDISGGAARAGYRLHQGLRQIGVDSQQVVARKHTTDSTVHAPNPVSQRVVSRIQSVADELPSWLYPDHDDRLFSSSWLPSPTVDRIESTDPDVVHLHWINAGLLCIEDLPKFNVPVVWTMHDMWPLTGGCHYNRGCTRFEERCGSCPALGSESDMDLSRVNWKRKQRSWTDLDLTIVTPSHWLAECVESSSMFTDARIEVIPNGINISAYKPVPQYRGKSLYDLPKDRNIILFGAADPTDPRKGYDQLIEGLYNIQDGAWKIDIVTFGSDSLDAFNDLEYDVHTVGRIDDIGLSLLYAAADVFVTPSLQDNLPNTVMESLACGTPVVAFDVGGIGDMIAHKKNGYLATPADATDLADGIQWVLRNTSEAELSSNARQVVEERFELESVARQYRDLYRSCKSNYT